MRSCGASFALVAATLAALSRALLPAVSGVFTAIERQELLTAHNRLRENAQPLAAAMLYMAWSDNLEAKAQLLADSCDERLGDFELSYHGFGEEPVPWQVVNHWYLQRRAYRGAGQCLSIPGDAAPCREFLQLLTDTAAEVGCARKLCGQVHHVRCLYSAQPAPNGHPYKLGNPCTGCPPDRPRCLYGLCAVAEVADAEKLSYKGAYVDASVLDNSVILMLTTGMFKPVSESLFHATLWPSLQHSIAKSLNDYCRSSAATRQACCKGGGGGGGGGGQFDTVESASLGDSHVNAKGVSYALNGLESRPDGNLRVLVYAKARASQLCSTASAAATESFVPSPLIREALRQHRDMINYELLLCCEDVSLAWVDLPGVQRSVAPHGAKPPGFAALTMAVVSAALVHNKLMYIHNLA